VTICDDSSLHLWHIDVKDGKSQLNLIRSISAEARYGICRLTAVCIYCMLFYSLYVQLLSFSFTVICVDCVFYCLLPSGVLNK